MANARRRKKTSTKAKEGQQDGKSLSSEVLIIAVCALALFMIVSIFTEKTGVLGAFIRRTLFGLFGIGALVLPFALFLGCVFAGFKQFKRSSVYKNALLAIIFACMVTLVHIGYYSLVLPESQQSFARYVAYYFNNGSQLNGGLLGAAFGNLLVRILGNIGAHILIWTIVIICMVLVTGRSLFEALHVAAKRTATTAKHTAERIKEVKVQYDGMQTPGRRMQHNKKFDYLLEPPKGAIEDIEPVEGGVPEIITQDNHPPFELDEPVAVIDMQGSAPAHVDTAPEDADSEIKILDFMVDEPKKKRKTKEPIGVLKEIDEADGSNTFIDYDYPPLDLLQYENHAISRGTKAEMLQNAKKLEDTLKSFGVIAKVVQINKGPAVTRYELTPNQGVKVSKIVNLSDDIALSLAANGIRIEAPVPGKSVVGIEVPNQDHQTVLLREILEADEFQGYPSKLAFGIGKDIGGKVVVSDIAQMPHLLIAGATGSGKSVCINTLITSILYKASPNEVKLLLIDPKVVELSVYNGIPHLLIPVVTDPKKAAGALNWAVAEMLNRYKLFSEQNVRDVKGYNGAKVEQFDFEGVLPQIIIIIDELADLMMAASKEVEDAIMRLAQMARAAGIHLIIATQRPSVDVITGVIKANIPSRLAFSVSSGTDSRTILDMVGAEKLLGKGDMLFYPIGMSKPVRVQGAFVSDREVENIVNYIKKDVEVPYDDAMVEQITSTAGRAGVLTEDADEFLEPAIELIIGKDKASVSMMQRQFRIGYNRAARLMEELETKGFVGPEDGSKPRKVLITQLEYDAMKENVGQ